MYQTIEKVSILNNLELFEGTPSYILASVAKILEIVEFKTNALIIEEGKLEDWMYIIVEGQVQVFSGEQPLMKLKKGDTVGELSILDPQIRSASVSAMEDVTLFRLTKPQFDEVMLDRPEISQNIIRSLVRQIRTQGEMLTSKGAEI